MEKKIENSKKQPLFTVHRIYTKEIIFTSPLMPQAAALVWEPDLKYTVEVASAEISPNIYEVILGFKLTIKVKDKSEKLEVCKFTMIQGGIFKIDNITEEEMAYALLVRAPEILYTYIQESASSCINKAGYPQVVLPFINFAEGIEDE